MKVTMTAPPITKARLGSHVPAKSKKLKTFAGFIIPDIAMPTPNRRPVKSAKISLIGFRLQTRGG